MDSIQAMLNDFHRWTHHLHGVGIDPYDLWVNVQLPDRQELTEIAVPCILAFEVMRLPRLVSCNPT